MAPRHLNPRSTGASRRVGVVLSRFNPEIGDGLLASALRGCKEAGVAEDDIVVVTVPGALETPLANESARGIGEVALQFGIPIGNGILTCDTEEQARGRMQTKGYEAAQAALEIANLFDDLDDT